MTDQVSRLLDSVTLAIDMICDRYPNADRETLAQAAQDVLVELRPPFTIATLQQALIKAFADAVPAAPPDVFVRIERGADNGLTTDIWVVPHTPRPPLVS